MGVGSGTEPYTRGSGGPAQVLDLGQVLSLRLCFLVCTAGGLDLIRKGEAAPLPALPHRDITHQSHALSAEFRSDLNVLSSAVPWAATTNGSWIGADIQGDTFLPSLQLMTAEVLSSSDHLHFVPSRFPEKGTWVCVQVSTPAAPGYHPNLDSPATEAAPGGATPVPCPEAPV